MNQQEFFFSIFNPVVLDLAFRNNREKLSISYSGTERQMINFKPDVSPRGVYFIKKEGTYIYIGIGLKRAVTGSYNLPSRIKAHISFKERGKSCVRDSIIEEFENNGITWTRTNHEQYILENIQIEFIDTYDLDTEIVKAIESYFIFLNRSSSGFRLLNK